MPVAMEKALEREADKKGLTGKSRAAFIYGTMRKTGWKPRQEVDRSTKNMSTRLRNLIQLNAKLKEYQFRHWDPDMNGWVEDEPTSSNGTGNGMGRIAGKGLVLGGAGAGAYYAGKGLGRAFPNQVGALKKEAGALASDVKGAASAGLKKVPGAQAAGSLVAQAGRKASAGLEAGKITYGGTTGNVLKKVLAAVKSGGRYAKHTFSEKEKGQVLALGAIAKQSLAKLRHG